MEAPPGLGARSRQRLWRLNKHTVVTNDEPEMIVPHEMYCFRFPAELFREGARSFDEFKMQDNVARHYRILYQAIFRMIEICVKLAANRNSAASAGDFPLSVYLECAEAKVSNIGSDVMHPLQDEQENQMGFEFLPGNKKIGEYRFWVMIRNDKISLGEALKKMMDKNVEKLKKKKKLMERNPMTADNDIYYQLAEHEKYLIIEDKYWWQRNICDIVTGSDTLSNAEIFRELDAKSIDDLENPGHPMSTFGWSNVFEYPNDMGVADEFNILENYYDIDSKQFSFHKPSNVLKINYREAKPFIMNSKFFPLYQKKQLYALAQDNAVNGRVNNYGRGQWRRKRIMTEEQRQKALQRREEQRRRNEIDMSQLDADTLAAMADLGESDSEDEQQFADNDEPMDSEVVDNYWSTVGNSISMARRPDGMGVALDFSLVQQELPEELANALLERMIKQTELSAYEELQQQAEPYIRMIDNIENTELRKEYYEIHRDWVFDEYAGRCMSTESNTSPNARLMLHWSQNHPDHLNVKAESKVYDSEMSLFGNMIIRHMSYFEDYMMFSHTHKSFLIIRNGAMDAYRHNFGLHFNNMSCGPGSRSKSFMYDVLEAHCIPGTVNTFTYKSLKADAVDYNQNDRIEIQHETPLSMFSEKFGQFNQAEAMMKEKLTSQTVKSIVFEKMPDGRRGNRTSVSQNISTMNCATNDNPDTLGEAFRSRFNWEMVREVERPGKDIVQMMANERLLSNKEKKKRERIKHEYMRDQLIHFHVEKLIMTTGLRAPTLTACRIVFDKISEYLKENCGTQMHTRTIQRMNFLARRLVVQHAIERLYNIPGHSKYYGEKFDIMQLKDMDELLHDTEEIAYFVAGLQKEQFLDPIEKIVLRRLKEMHETEVKPNNRYRQKYTDVGGGNSGKNARGYIQQYSRNKYRRGGPNPAHSGSRFAAHLQRQSNRSMNDDSSEIIDDGEDSLEEDFDEDAVMQQDRDYNYLSIPVKRQFLAKRIHDTLNEDPMPSTQSIVAVIKRLTERVIRSKSYTLDPDTQQLVIDEDSSISNHPAFHVNEYGDCHIHASLFDENFLGRDELSAAIESTYHQHTVSRKVISGEVLHETRYPNFFKTFETFNQPENTMFIANPLYMANTDNESNEEIDEFRSHPYRMIDHDLDTLSLLHRQKELFVPASTEEDLALHIEKHIFYRDESFRESMAAQNMHSGKNYPNDYVRDKELKIREWKRHQEKIKRADAETLKKLNIPRESQLNRDKFRVISANEKDKIERGKKIMQSDLHQKLFSKKRRIIENHSDSDDFDNQTVAFEESPESQKNRIEIQNSKTKRRKTIEIDFE